MIEKIKRQSLKKIIIMLWNILRMLLLRSIKRNQMNVSLLQNLHPSTEIAVEKGNLHLAHSVFTRKNVSFRVVSGELSIGTSFFNQGCSITAMEKIEIGDDCLFGPNVVIVDHDHDYRLLNNQRGNHYLCDSVSIGNNVWIGANVTILRGSIIGDNCVIGAGCVVKGVIKNNTVLVSKQNLLTRSLKS